MVKSATSSSKRQPFSPHPALDGNQTLSRVFCFFMALGLTHSRISGRFRRSFDNRSIRLKRRF